MSVNRSQAVEGNLNPNLRETRSDGLQEHFASQLTQSRNTTFFSSAQPVTGTLNVLAVPLRFSDLSNTTSIANIVSQKLNTTSSYYSEVSYGSVLLNFFTLDSWLTLPHSHNSYGADFGSQIDVNLNDFIRDSLSLAEPYVNYHNYGYVMLIHVGNDEAQPGGSLSDLWSQASLGKEYYPNAGGVDLGLSILAENDPYGTFSHELGHNLGLLDLYDNSLPSGSADDDFVADWSLMGSGNWLEPPASIMATEKMWLGWVSENNVTVVDTGQIFNVALSKLETPGQVLAVKILVNSTYCVVEYREKTLTDSALPMGGVIVSYVDESIPSGQGPVRIQDANPSTTTLDDAVFQGGERFVDEANQVAVKVWSLGYESANITVQKGFADLCVDKVQIVGVAVEGQDVYFDVYVNNKGVTSSDSATVSLSINGSDFESKELPPVTPNSTALVQFGPWHAKSGLNQIQVTADVNDDVVEGNKTNNVMLTTLDVYPSHTTVVDQAEVSRPRADIDSSQQVHFHAKWSDNSSDTVNGTLYVNGSAYVTNSTGWVSVEATSGSVGNFSYQITGADVNGFTSFIQQVPNPYIIWDTLEVYDYGVSRPRCDVNSTQRVWVRLQYAYDKSIFDNSTGTLKIGGKSADWDEGEGYWHVIDSRHDVGQNNYTAPTSFEDELYRLTSASSIAKISIIWDRVALALSPKDQRINVGSTVEFQVNGTYEYDSATWNGTGALNDTLTRSQVGMFAYAVTSMTDPSYGLTVFESNIAYVIFDRVRLNLAGVNDRVSVGARAEISVTGQYEYDNSPWNGTVAFNDTVTKTSVGNYGLTVTMITDAQHNITAFEANSLSLIWDQVNITLSTSHMRISFKSKAVINWTGLYEYDGKPFAGNITLNDDLIKNTVGSVTYHVENVSDPLYGLAAFASNAIQIIFDDITCKTKLETATPGKTTLEINLTYQFDGAPVTDARITIGNIQTENTGNGRYTATVSEWAPYAIYHVDIENDTFLKGFDVSSVAVGNASIIGVAAVVLIVSAFLFAKQRKKRKQKQ